MACNPRPEVSRMVFLDRTVPLPWRGHGDRWLNRCGKSPLGLTAFGKTVRRTMPGFIPLQLRWNGQHSVQCVQYGRKECTPQAQGRTSGCEWIRCVACSGQFSSHAWSLRYTVDLYTLLPISLYRTTSELIPLSVRNSTTAVQLD
jgi:hypothetical protein